MVYVICEEVEEEVAKTSNAHVEPVEKHTVAFAAKGAKLVNECPVGVSNIHITEVTT